MSPSDFNTHRAYLRTNTAQAHNGLEQSWFGSDGFRSEGHYRAFLTRSLFVHQVFGLPAAGLWGDPADSLTEQQRIAALQADTQRSAFHLAPPARLTSKPICESQAWGVAYVLNGATLGASVMLKTGKIPNVWPQLYMVQGRGFVQSGGLMRFFDRLNAAQIDRDLAVMGANACFAAFTQETRVAPQPKGVPA